MLSTRLFISRRLRLPFNGLESGTNILLIDTCNKYPPHYTHYPPPRYNWLERLHCVFFTNRLYAYILFAIRIIVFESFFASIIDSITDSWKIYFIAESKNVIFTRTPILFTQAVTVLHVLCAYRKQLFWLYHFKIFTDLSVKNRFNCFHLFICSRQNS